MNIIPLFEQPLEPTPIYRLSGDYGKNQFYVKRDDMIPFSFGGNKARKAAEFYTEIKKSNADVVITYGNNSSNHCRIIANMAASMGLSCHIISPDEKVTGIHGGELNNTKLVKDFHAVIEVCSVDKVAETIENRKKAYLEEGRKPYFIMGGGHGNCGTAAYVKAYNEILEYQIKNGISFDYIFHASGTGTTQAGLICGMLQAISQGRLAENGIQKPQIAGISIAREEARGASVVKESIRDYLGEQFDTLFRPEELLFTDAYRAGGYGQYTQAVTDVIEAVMKQDGMPTDTTYVGKAFYGMTQYCQEQKLEGKNILFIHTGGAPLYFDNL